MYFKSTIRNLSFIASASAHRPHRRNVIVFSSTQTMFSGLDWQELHDPACSEDSILA